MHSETKRLIARFTDQFSKGGLENIKFFVRRGSQPTLEEFAEEVNKIQDTITADGFSVVKAVDTDVEQKKFDEPFTETV